MPPLPQPGAAPAPPGRTSAVALRGSRRRQPRPQALSRAGEPAQGSRAGAEAPGTESRKLTDVDVAARSRRRSGTARLCSRRVGLGRGGKLSPGVVNRRARAPPLFGDQLGQAADAWPVLGEHGVGLSRREVRAPGATRPWAGGTGPASSEHPDPSGVPEAGRPCWVPARGGAGGTPAHGTRLRPRRAQGSRGRLAQWPSGRPLATDVRTDVALSSPSYGIRPGRGCCEEASAANEGGAPGGRAPLRGGSAGQQSAPRPGGSWGRGGASPCCRSG